MEVTFYSNFKKRINSTKRPSGGVTKEVLLKEPTDLHNPVLKIQGNTLWEYNYFSIGTAYYYITSEVRCPNYWVEYTGTIDAMATCADDIKATTAFVERSQSGSTAFVDTLAPAMTTKQVLSVQSEALPWSFSGGRYIVSFTNLLQPAVMTEGEFANLYERLNAPDIYEQLKDLLTGGIENYITSAIYVPLVVPSGGSQALKTNSLDLGISVSLLLIKYDTTTMVFEFADIDDTSWSSSAYCDMNLFLPFVGNVQLSVDTFKASKSMVVQVGIDYSTGGLYYIIKAGSEIVATYNGSCATAVGIGYSGGNMLSTVGGGIMAIGSIAMGNAVGAIAGAAAAFTGLKGSTGQISAASGNKAFAMDTNVRVSITRRNIAEGLSVKSSAIGLPTYKTLSLGSVNGFVKCINASIASVEEMSVVQECNNYLNSGAWIE